MATEHSKEFWWEQHARLMGRKTICKLQLQEQQSLIAHVGFMPHVLSGRPRWNTLPFRVLRWSMRGARIASWFADEGLIPEVTTQNHRRSPAQTLGDRRGGGGERRGFDRSGRSRLNETRLPERWRSKCFFFLSSQFQNHTRQKWQSTSRHSCLSPAAVSPLSSRPTRPRLTKAECWPRYWQT